MNALYLGEKRQIALPRTGFLFIDDEPPIVPRSRVFDPHKSSFNPLKNINYRGACDLVDIIDCLFERGNTTLSKDTGLDFIADALEGAPKTLDRLIPPPDKKSSTGHQWAYGKVRRILRSPVLYRCLCNATNFSFKKGSMIFAHINRAELGDFDALCLGLFLMSHYRGQVVVPDGGFYLRDMHVSLIREKRLIVGASFLSELPVKVRQHVLLFKDKVVSGAVHEDAVTLAKYARLTPGTNEFNDYVNGTMA